MRFLYILCGLCWLLSSIVRATTQGELQITAESVMVLCAPDACPEDRASFKIMLQGMSACCVVQRCIDLAFRNFPEDTVISSYYDGWGERNEANCKNFFLAMAMAVYVDVDRQDYYADQLKKLCYPEYLCKAPFLKSFITDDALARLCYDRNIVIRCSGLMITALVDYFMQALEVVGVLVKTVNRLPRSGDSDKFFERARQAREVLRQAVDETRWWLAEHCSRQSSRSLQVMHALPYYNQLNIVRELGGEGAYVGRKFTADDEMYIGMLAVAGVVVGLRSGGCSIS